MPEISVDQVFGVSRNMILSYLERDQVDGRFKTALESDKHIVIYGSSKQGKSALIQKHLNLNDFVVVGCTPRSDTESIYSSVLRQIGVEIKSTNIEKTGTSGKVAVNTSFKAMIPFFGEGKAGVDTELGGQSGQDITYKTIEFNLGIAQDISELLDECQFKKFIILDNFHYLNEEVQKALAFDLRLFQEKGYQFIILGVWREKNRLIQFNGDLIDRIIEIPVEPWEESEFRAVIGKGCAHLNISIENEIISKIISVSFGSIGTVQELCKELCLTVGLQVKSPSHMMIDNEDLLDQAIKVKVEEYSSRHMRALESIATAGVQVEGLFMPYYVVRTIIEMDVSNLLDGISRNVLQDEIKAIHHRPDSVRPSDMSYVLHGLADIQSKKMVIPPLFDYDRVNRRLRIIDSTLFFFLKYKNKQELLEEIPSPLEGDRES